MLAVDSQRAVAVLDRLFEGVNNTAEVEGCHVGSVLSQGRLLGRVGEWERAGAPRPSWAFRSTRTGRIRLTEGTSGRGTNPAGVTEGSDSLRYFPYTDKRPYAGRRAMSAARSSSAR